MYDAPNAVEKLKQPRKHPTAEKVEAIKDALNTFTLITLSGFLWESITTVSTCGESYFLY